MTETATPIPDELAVEELSVWFDQAGAPFQALDRVSFTVPQGGFITLLGPNGCGKSTLLHVLAGLVPPGSGRVRHRGDPIVGPDASRLLLFQDRTLFPWLNVAQNVGFGLRARGVPRPEREARVREVLDRVGLSRFAHAWPFQLSGGMRQRAELARALAVEPRVLLLDEPFANLDSLTRELFQEELLALRQKSGITFLMVTHDIAEAVFLSDRILLLERPPGGAGRIQDVVEIDAGSTGGAGSARTTAWRGHAEFAALSYRILSRLREELLSGKE